MATYPSGIYTGRTMTNRAGAVYDVAKTKVVYAEDWNLDRAEITAIQTELGTLPKGSFGSVKLRLDDIDSQLAGVGSKFLVSLGTTQSIPSAAVTLLELDTVAFDANSDFDVDLYRFVAPENGYYQFNGSVRLDVAVAAKNGFVSIRKNGSHAAVGYGHTGSTGDVSFSISTLLYLAADDYVDLAVRQDFGVAEDAVANIYSTFLSGFRVK